MILVLKFQEDGEIFCSIWGVSLQSTMANRVASEYIGIKCIFLQYPLPLNGCL
jgi:hypothetical protein